MSNVTPSLFLIGVCTCALVCGQGMSGMEGLRREIDNRAFQSCPQVEAVARELARDISDQVSFMQLYPVGRRPPYFAFNPDNQDRVGQVTEWIERYQPQRVPFALFYFVHGAYVLRCRDENTHFSELISPAGNPLSLNITSGEAVIWHFFFTPNNVAHVFVITNVALERLNGEQLLAEIKERLGARFLFLYTRNDPWFFDSSLDTLPYAFTDSFRRLSAAEYRETHTMICSTGQKCRIK